MIFSFWTTTLDLVGKALEDLEIPYVRIDGRVPGSKRQEAIASFKNDSTIRALLISLKCGSNG